MKRVVIDTNGYSNLLRGDENVSEFLKDSNIIYFPVFVIAELYYGFKKGNKDRKNRNLLKKFLEDPKVTIAFATLKTAEIFADIKFLLSKNGTPLPINDIWIAALTIEKKSQLLTFDKHFKYIKNLKLWNNC